MRIRRKGRMHNRYKMVSGRVLFSDGCSKSVGSSTIGYEADWRVNHGLQSNQFVSGPVEEEEE